MMSLRIVLLFLIGIVGQVPPSLGLAVREGQTIAHVQQTITHDRDIASTYAPIFYQALGSNPRSDYLTNFNFDGDWRGDNNWDNADQKKFPLKAYVYYAVSETATHFFIHYAVFHPRDYNGGARKGTILSELIREGARRGGKYDPTGLADETSLAHENDFEGCLVAVDKNGPNLANGRVAFVETLQHNLFSRYIAATDGAPNSRIVRVESNRVLLYIEPKGHGIEAYDGSAKQIGEKEFVIYRFAGKAQDPEKQSAGSVGYDLIPLQVLWSKAKTRGLKNGTYGEAKNYGSISILLRESNGKAGARKVSVGNIGTAFLGKVGGQNMARPPWAWFDRNTRDEPLGLWFFDPATTIKRHFSLGETFPTAYVRLPFWAH